MKPVEKTSKNLFWAFRVNYLSQSVIAGIITSYLPLYLYSYRSFEGWEVSLAFLAQIPMLFKPVYVKIGLNRSKFAPIATLLGSVVLSMLLATFSATASIWGIFATILAINVTIAISDTTIDTGALNALKKRTSALAFNMRVFSILGSNLAFGLYLLFVSDDLT